MIKGVNRTIIEVSNPCNRYFERALLFVRPSLEEIPHKRLQLQADCFVETLGPPPLAKSAAEAKRRNRKYKRILLCCFWWLTGFLVGAFIGWLIW
ncbi:MAG: hypothetical protein IKU10_02425 [Clostridia bacterium]|nr:hypothetical protein [Clostridia bacterium]